MSGQSSFTRIFVSVAFLLTASCKYDSSLTMSSAEWNPQIRARNDALVASGLPPTNDPSVNHGVKILQPSAGTQSARDWTFDPLYIISAPVYWIWDGLLHFVVTDTDPKTRPKFETRLFYAASDLKSAATNSSTKVSKGPPAAPATGPSSAPTAPPPDASTTAPPAKPEAPSASTPPSKSDLIRDDATFEVHLTYLAIDYFTGGRLRDAWGGQGGQVSVQTSLNALSDAGMLLSDDTKFVVENEVKRRSPLLALAKATAKGRDFVDEVTNRAKSVLDEAKELDLTIDKIKGYVQKIKDETNKDARPQLLETLRQDAYKVVDAKIPLLFKNSDEATLAKQIADSVLKSIFDDLSSHLNDPGIDAASNWVQTTTDKLLRHLDQANVVLEYFGKYNVDEEGIYETAKIIVGLADADRRSTLEFENVKPSLIQFSGEAGGGTAATLLGDDLNGKGTSVLATDSANSGTDLFHAEARDQALDQQPSGSGAGPVISERGLVYRGTLRELSRTMTGVEGFSLSFLMIDRGDDRVVRALRMLQQYTDQSGLTIGGGGAQIQVSAIVDALATLAQKISEDKVELRTIDLRFMSAAPRSGSTPGHELFALRPCTILISRNLSGKKFGAVAEITISRAK